MNNSNISYDDEFERSLVSSTPYSSSRSRKSVVVSSSSTSLPTRKSSSDEFHRSSWEQWIIEKAQIQKQRDKEFALRSKEEQLKLKEAKKEKKERERKKEQKLKEWEERKINENRLRLQHDKQLKQEREDKLEAKKQELLEKSVVAVAKWNELKSVQSKQKIEREKLIEAKTSNEQILRESLSKQKYKEWLTELRSKDSSSSLSTDNNRNLSLKELYKSNPTYYNPVPWSGSTDIQYKPTKILYTSIS